ncbi:MAG: alpha/beta hydrolase [Acidimicrobiales bacterium]
MTATEITFYSGPLKFGGTLACGDPSKPGPAALLISGSGPLDRDSNTKKLSIDVMAQIAAHLERSSITSFRFDKRGVGASEGDYHACGFADNVADARAALAALRERPEVDEQQVFVIGHSEGAIIAAELAATKLNDSDPDLAGTILLACPATDGRTVLRWQAKQLSGTLPRPVALLLKLLRKDLAAIQDKRLKQIAATTEDTVRVQLVKINAKWLREFMAHDPAPSLRLIDTPVLAVTGASDVQVDPAHTEQIRQLVPGPCTVRVIDDLTHLLRTEPGAPSLKTYKKQAKRPVDPELLGLLTNWIDDTIQAQPHDDLQSHAKSQPES